MSPFFCDLSGRQSCLNLHKQHLLPGLSLSDKEAAMVKWNNRFEEQTNLLNLTGIGDNTCFCCNNAHKNVPNLVKSRTLSKLLSARAVNKEGTIKKGCHSKTYKKSQCLNDCKLVNSRRPNELTRKYHCLHRAKPIKESTLSEVSQKNCQSDEIEALTLHVSSNDKTRHQNRHKFKGITYSAAHSLKTSIHDYHNVKTGNRRRQNNHNAIDEIFPVSCNGNKSNHNLYEDKTGQRRHKNDHKVKRVTSHFPHISKTRSDSDHKIDAGKPRHEDDNKIKAEIFQLSSNGNISNHVDRDVKSVTLPLSWNGKKLKAKTFSTALNVKTSNRNDHEIKAGTKRYHMDHNVKIELFPVPRCGKTSTLEDHEVKAGNRRRQNDQNQVKTEIFRVSCSGNTINHNDHKVKSVNVSVSWSGKINYKNVYNPGTSFVASSGKPCNHSYREVKTWTTFPVFLSGETNYQNVNNVKKYTTLVARSGETNNHNYSEVKTLRSPLSWNVENIYPNNHTMKAEILPISWSGKMRNKQGIVAISRKLQNSMHSEEDPHCPFENKRNHVQSCKCVYKMNPVEYEKYIENLKHELLAYSDTCYYGPMAEELMDVSIRNAVTIARKSGRYSEQSKSQLLN